ncbi:MAG: helix-turn-helix domain-containing protein [Vicinamibacterales bacterium]
MVECRAGAALPIATLEMFEGDVSRRLCEARSASGEGRANLAKRIGVREEHLRAIEEGRLGDLPKGIYGRAAIRSFAQACGFDPAETLAASEPFLAQVDEPISALGRRHGVRQPRTPPPVAEAAGDAGRPQAPDAAAEGIGAPLAQRILDAGRVLAAAAIDAVIIVTLLLAVVVSALTALMVPVSALAQSGPAFGVMGALLAALYFAWFGGLRGATIGEQLLPAEAAAMGAQTRTLNAIASRAVDAATRDARAIQRLGASVGACTLGRAAAEDSGIGHFEQPASR